MEWIKRGLIFSPLKRFDWMDTYAQVPRVFDMGYYLRIYFTSRPQPDSKGNFISRIGLIEVDRTDFSKILHIYPSPILDLGGIGSFDHFGTMPGSIIRCENGDIWLYYTGWQRGVDVPYITCIGLAVSKDNGTTFYRAFNGPILGLDLQDGYLVNGPWVINALGKWHMWYSSATEWIEYDGRPEVRYLIKHAISEDGISWERESEFCIKSTIEMECQNSPSVICIGNLFYMWFCFRHTTNFRNSGRGYRLGLACSTDLKSWNRIDDQLGLGLSESGWDSEMIAYPGIYDIDGKITLFYNGNDFGKSGFGYAELER